MKPDRGKALLAEARRREVPAVDAMGMWYGPWRQFCFFPEPESVWSKGCLDDVKDYLERLRDERKGG